METKYLFSEATVERIASEPSLRRDISAAAIASLSHDLQHDFAQVCVGESKAIQHALINNVGRGCNPFISREAFQDDLDREAIRYCLTDQEVRIDLEVGDNDHNGFATIEGIHIHFDGDWFEITDCVAPVDVDDLSELVTRKYQDDYADACDRAYDAWKDRRIDA